MKSHIDKPSLKTVLIYYLFGFCWVFFANPLFFRSLRGIAVPVIPYLKGTIFVTVTGVVIYFLIHHQFRKEQKLIEEKKEVIRDREVILRELNHRVKNNLQVLESFIHLEMSKVENDGFCSSVLQKLYFRLQTISMVHHNIYNLPDTPYVNLKTVFISSLPSYESYFLSSANLVSLKYDIEDIQVPIDMAIPLALVTNELLVNSCKYAYPDGKTGDIILSVKYQYGMIHVTVSDNGVGFCDDLMKSGDCSGLVLVKTLLEQVNGKLDKLHSGGTGTTFIVDIPYALI